jgi:hypothetical protein
MFDRFASHIIAPTVNICQVCLDQANTICRQALFWLLAVRLLAAYLRQLLQVKKQTLYNPDLFHK